MKTGTLIRAGMAVLLTTVTVTAVPFSHAATDTGAADTPQKKVETAEQDQSAADSSWNPWNWFRHEENTGAKVPIQQGAAKEGGKALTGPLQEFHHEVDRLFNNMFRDFNASSFDFHHPFMLRTADGAFRPTLDLSAGDKEYTVTVELPGADEDDIKVELVDNVMTISGEKKQEKEKKDKDHYRQERYFGAFQRVLTLPEDADQEGIKAKFKQGVLTVTVPRKPMPKSKVKEIEIHT
ncbi:MAG: Hsp20/alpha crystallin family protein [Candidatus Electrothrix sp. YB6]